MFPPCVHCSLVERDRSLLRLQLNQPVVEFMFPPCVHCSLVERDRYSSRERPILY